MLFLKVNKLKAKIIIISNLLFENWSGKKRLRRCLFELRVGFHCEVLSSCIRWYEETQRLASHQRQLPNWTLWALNRKRILGANLFFAASMTGSSYLCGRGGASRCRSTEEGKEPLDWHHSYLCCLWSKLLRLAPCCPARKCWAIIGKYGGWHLAVVPTFQQFWLEMGWVYTAAPFLLRSLTEIRIKWLPDPEKFLPGHFSDRISVFDSWRQIKNPPFLTFFFSHIWPIGKSW